jgi:two-component system NtrC family sensor kinase
MVVIYWTFDSLASGQYMTRILIAALVIVYGIFTQTLINGRKQALLEKERTQAQLIQSESLAAIGQLVAGIAHELNSPLASASSFIQTDIELIEEQPEKRPVDREVLQDLTYALKELNRTKEIVRSVLDLSRQRQTYEEDVDMNGVLEDALRVLHNTYKSKEVVIEKNYDPHLPVIKGNFSNLGQVLINVIKNALQALPDGKGRIFLSTSYNREADRVVVECRDEGGGIDPSVVRDIFKPFFTTKDVGKGSGLGLYVSYEIIKKHSGEIRVSSEVAKGTTVTIELPCRRGGKS